MLRTPDGQLVILDFGLMTRITDDQKYGMIEAIAHLIHRDYDLIGQDFVSLGFIPKGTDTRPIIPALARVFEAALAGGGAKSINFQELAADLAEITFKYPFAIPPYFALIIRAISVLEGIALVGNPEFAIIDEAYPFISKRLLTSPNPRLKAAFRYMVYGKSNTLDIDRMIDLLQAFEKFVAVKDFGDGSSYKKDGLRGEVFVGRAGESVGSRKLQADQLPSAREARQGSSEREEGLAREALKLFFSDDGLVFREMILDELTAAIDSLSRDAVREVVLQLGIPGQRIPPLLRALAPRLSDGDRKVVDNIRKLSQFFVASSNGGGQNWATEEVDLASLVAQAGKAENRRRLQQLAPLLREFAPGIRSFGQLVTRRLVEKTTSRLLQAGATAVFG